MTSTFLKYSLCGKIIVNSIFSTLRCLPGARATSPEPRQLDIYKKSCKFPVVFPLSVMADLIRSL